MDAERTERLARYVDVWRDATDEFIALAEDTPESLWSTPTDLPGWDIHAVVAHQAHLESLLAGGQHRDIDVGDPAHVRSDFGRFMEQGVVARRDSTAAELIAELRGAVSVRSAKLAATPPTDPDRPGPGFFGLAGMTTEVLLRNRPLDVWLHEQDLRRAIGRPGGLQCLAAQHTVDYLLESIPFVVGKRVAPPEGSVVRVHVVGERPIAVVVDGGRAQLLDVVPTAHEVSTAIDLDREAFTLLAAGRRTPPAGAVRVTGDRTLGQSVLDHLVVTP